MKDFVHDNNPTPMFYLHDLGELPDYVKQAEVITPGSVDVLHNNAFADPKNRLFPLHTKEAAYLSAAYFYGHGLADQDVETRIKSAAEAYDIKEDVDALDDIFASAQEKYASEDDPKLSYALEVDMGKELGINHFYPIRDAYEIEKSAAQITQDMETGRLPLELAREASVGILAAAEKYASDGNPPIISRKIAALGEDRIPDFELMRTHANMRKHATWPNEIEDQYLELYQDICTGAEAEYEENIKEGSFTAADNGLVKWAELMLDVDRMAGITNYDHKTVTPYEAIFGGHLKSDLEKMAQATVFLGTAGVPKHAFEAIPTHDLRAQFTAQQYEAVASWQEKDASAINDDLAQFFDEEDERTLLKLAIRHG